MDKRRGEARQKNPPRDVYLEDIAGSLFEGFFSEFARNRKHTLPFSQLSLASLHCSLNFKSRTGS
jgi:hypothetical protein